MKGEVSNMEYNIYIIDIYGNAHFLQKATDFKSANRCCDIYFDDLYERGEIIINGTCFMKDHVYDIEMVRADKDNYKGVRKV